MPLPPQLPDPSFIQRKKFWLTAIWIASFGIIAPPLIGLIVTGVGMKNVYGQLGKSGNDIEALNQHISVILISTATVFGISLLAFGFLILSLIRYFTLKPDRSSHREG